MLKRMKKLLCLIVIVVFGIETVQYYTPTSVVQATNVKVPSLTKTASIIEGKTKTLAVKANGTAIKKISWKSSNKKVATVKSNGQLNCVVKGVKKGTAKITAVVSYEKDGEPMENELVYEIIVNKKITSFKQYYNEILKKKYGVFKRKQTGTMHQWEDEWLSIRGVMGAAVKDFDLDGKKEMMVIVAKMLDDGKHSKIMMQMYEKNKNGIIMSSELRFNPYYDWVEKDEVRGITLSNAQWMNELFIINSLKKGKKQYIVCEEREIAGAFADGEEQNYWIIEYKNNKLNYISSFTQTDGGSSGFEHTYFKIKNGKIKKSVLYYGDEDSVAFGAKPKYKKFEIAIKKYFNNHGIKIRSGIKHYRKFNDESVLLKKKNKTQLFMFYNKATKSDYKNNIYINLKQQPKHWII